MGAKKNLDLWEALDKEVRRQKHVQWIWLRGHNGNKYNEIFDQLATEAMNHACLEQDTGYHKSRKEKSEKTSGGAMAIRLPMSGTYTASPKSAEQEAIEKGCKESCIVAIRLFYQKKNHAFIKCVVKPLASAMGI